MLAYGWGRALRVTRLERCRTRLMVVRFRYRRRGCTLMSCSGRGDVSLAGYAGAEDGAPLSDGARDMIVQGDAGTFRVELG